MRVTLIIAILAATIFSAVFWGCSFADEDYRSGVYWLEKESNPQSAARAFQRSLERRPNKWKPNQKLIEALSQTDQVSDMETAIRELLRYFPDSSRAFSVAGPAAELLGEDRYDKLTSSIELHHVGQLLARKGDNPTLLSRAIMATCRGNDTFMVVGYFNRLIELTGDEGIPDTVLQEMNFFVGPARVEWMRQEWKVGNDPSDVNARSALVDMGILMGDSVATFQKLKELIDLNPDAELQRDLAKRFGMVAGIDPFQSNVLVKGWDGAYSSDGKFLVYINDRGHDRAIDQYIYRSKANGSGETPIMKANQQFLTSLALPRFSPDGRWIYFYGSADKHWAPGVSGNFHLYRVKPSYGSKPRKLTSAELLPIIPHFEADGSLLLLRRDLGSSRASVEVIRLNPEQRSLSKVSRIGEPVVGATFNSSGDSIIFATKRGVYRRAVDGGRFTVELIWQGLNFLLLSPDDTILLASTKAGQTLLIDRSTGKPTFLGITSTPLAFMDDSGKLLMTRNIKNQNHVVQIQINDDTDYTSAFRKALTK